MKTTENLALEVVLIDDDPAYRQRVEERLRSRGHRVFGSGSSDPRDYSPRAINEDRALQGEDGIVPESGVDLVIVDNRYEAGLSYWARLLESLRLQHPRALLLLVSELDEEELKEEVQRVLRGGMSSPFTGDLFRGDPMLSYLPKPKKSEGTGHENSDSEHLERLVEIADDVSNHKTGATELMKVVFHAAMVSARELRSTNVMTLVAEVPGDKQDTKGMDVVTERHIKRLIGPLMHYHDVLICTEEAGLHNDLFHRINAPRFFVFSDPFDGSSGFKNLVSTLVGRDKSYEKMTLAEILETDAAHEYWKETHGNMTLNSPMVSVVLAERHRVIFAVLVNLFTKDVYISTERGNFHLPEAELDTERELFDLDGNGWRSFDLNSLPKERELFLCTLAKRNTKPSNLSSHYRHADECLGPLLRTVCDWNTSLGLRYSQGNFTPGPGRILFLGDVETASQYYSETMPGKRYASILSAGEPLTEWIGWLAFLRHMKGLSLYCLRRKEMASGRCPHRRTPEDVSTHQPDEALSIFRKGFIDLAVLQTAYGSRVRSYCDTILVTYCDDEAWRGRLKDGEEDIFERVWHLGPSGDHAQ